MGVNGARGSGNVRQGNHWTVRYTPRSEGDLVRHAEACECPGEELGLPSGENGSC